MCIRDRPYDNIVEPLISTMSSNEEKYFNIPTHKTVRDLINILEKYDLSLATMEVSYMKGLFDKPEEFTTLASFYLYKKNPAMSAKVLENAISEDQILFDTKNAKLLSDSWLFAKERIKSLALMIDKQVQQLSEKIGQLGEARMILLASLVLF